MIEYGKDKDGCHFDCIINFIDTHRFRSETQVLNGKECPDLDCNSRAVTLRYLIDLIEKEPKDFEPSGLDCKSIVKNNVPRSTSEACDAKLSCSSLHQQLPHINNNLPDFEVGACIEVSGETDGESKYSSASEEPFSDFQSNVDEKELLARSGSHCTEDLDIGANIFVKSAEEENYPNHINHSVSDTYITNNVSFTAGTSVIQEISGDFKNNQEEQLQHASYIEEVCKIDRYEKNELHNTESDFNHLTDITCIDENSTAVQHIEETDLKIENELSHGNISVDKNEVLLNSLEYHSNDRSCNSDSKVIKEQDNTLENGKHNDVCLSIKASPPISLPKNNFENCSENLQLKNIQNDEVSGFNICTNVDENDNNNTVSNTDKKLIIEPDVAKNGQQLVSSVIAVPTQHEKFECDISESATPKHFDQPSNIINEVIESLNDMLNKRNEKHSTLVEISNSDEKLRVVNLKDADNCMESAFISNAISAFDENIKEKELAVQITEPTTPVSFDESDSNSYDFNLEYNQLMSPPPSFLSDLKQQSHISSVQTKFPDTKNSQETMNDGKPNFSKSRKNTITIEQILKEREEQKKHQEEIKICRQKLQNIGELNVEDEFSDEEERQGFLNSKKCLANQESQIIQEDRTNNLPPGLDIFGKALFSYFTYQDITFQNCGYTNSGLTKFEEMVLNIPSVTLSENLPSILNNYHFCNVTNHNAFLLYLFKMAAVNDPLSVSCCEKTIKKICCNSNSETNISWCPHPVNVFEVFLNYGIDTNAQCPLRGELQKVEKNLISQTQGFQRNDEEKPKLRNSLPNHCRWSATNINLDSTLNILSTLIDNCCLYSDEELCKIIILLLWISLDSNILGTKTEVKIEKCVASAVKQISPKSWKVQAEILANAISSLCQHHRNILNVISLLPISVQRERKLQQSTSYLALQKLLDCENKVFVFELKLDCILHLLKNKQLHKIPDFYLLHTITSLIDLCVGYEPHHDQMDILDRLGVYFINTHSRILDDARYPESTQVKSHLIRIQCKWKLLNSTLEVQKNLSMHTSETIIEGVNQNIEKISVVNSTADVDDENFSDLDEILIAKLFDSHDDGKIDQEMEHYKIQNEDSDDEKVMDKVFSCQNIRTEMLNLNSKLFDNKISGALSNSDELEQPNEIIDSSNDSDEEKMMNLLCTGPEAQKFLENIKLNALISGNQHIISEKYNDTFTDNINMRNGAATQCIKNISDNSTRMGEMKIPHPEKLDQIKVLNNMNSTNVTESLKNNLNYEGSKEMLFVSSQHVSTNLLSNSISKNIIEEKIEPHCIISTFNKNKEDEINSKNALEFVTGKPSDTPTLDYFQKDSHEEKSKQVYTLSLQKMEQNLNSDNSDNTEFSMKPVSHQKYSEMGTYLNIDDQGAVEYANVTGDQNVSSPKSEELVLQELHYSKDSFEISKTTDWKDLSQSLTPTTDSKEIKSLQMEMYSTDIVKETKNINSKEVKEKYVKLINLCKQSDKPKEALEKLDQASNSVTCKDLLLPAVVENKLKDMDSWKMTLIPLHSGNIDEVSHLIKKNCTATENISFSVNQSKKHLKSKEVSKLQNNINSKTLATGSCKDLSEDLIASSYVRDLMDSEETKELLSLDSNSEVMNTSLTSENEALINDHSKEFPKVSTLDDLNSVSCEDLPVSLVTKDFLHSKNAEMLLTVDLKSGDINRRMLHINSDNQAVARSMMTINQNKVMAESNNLEFSELPEAIVSSELLIANNETNSFTDSKGCETLIPKNKNNLLTNDIISKSTMTEISNLNLQNQTATECVKHIDFETKNKEERSLLSEKPNQTCSLGASSGVPCQDISKSFVVENNANDCVDSKETSSVSLVYLKGAYQKTSHLNIESCITTGKVSSSDDHIEAYLISEKFEKLLDDINNLEVLNAASYKNLPEALDENHKDLVDSKDAETIRLNLKGIKMGTSQLNSDNQAVGVSKTFVDDRKKSPESNISLIVDGNASFLHSSENEILLAVDFKSKDTSTETSHSNSENQAVEESRTSVVDNNERSPKSNEFLCEELPKVDTQEKTDIVNYKDLPETSFTNNNVKVFLHSSESESLLATHSKSKDTSTEASYLNVENSAVEGSETSIVDQSKERPESDEILCKNPPKVITSQGTINCEDLPSSLKSNHNAKECPYSSETYEGDLKSNDISTNTHFCLENEVYLKGAHQKTSHLNIESCITTGKVSSSPVVDISKESVESNEFLCKVLPETNVIQDLNNVLYKDLSSSSNSNMENFAHSSKMEVLLEKDSKSKEKTTEVSHLDLENQTMTKSTMPVDQVKEVDRESNRYVCEELPAPLFSQCLNSTNCEDLPEPSLANDNTNYRSKEQETSTSDIISKNTVKETLSLNLQSHISAESNKSMMEELSNTNTLEVTDSANCKVQLESLIADNAEHLLNFKNANTSEPPNMYAEMPKAIFTNTERENEDANIHKDMQGPIYFESYDADAICDETPSEVIDLCNSDSSSVVCLTDSDDDCVIESVIPHDRSHVIVIDFTDEESNDI